LLQKKTGVDSDAQLSRDCPGSRFDRNRLAKSMRGVFESDSALARIRARNYSGQRDTVTTDELEKCADQDNNRVRGTAFATDVHRGEKK